MTKFTTNVRGREHEWVVEVSAASVEDMRADGIEVHEVTNAIPDWIVDAGLGRLWVLVGDMWDAPSRLWLKWRMRK